MTVAVDSPETVEAARGTGAEVLVDVDVGLPRCGMPTRWSGPDGRAGPRAAGLVVRGVMGYEGHVVGNPDRAGREAAVEESMALLHRAREDVGGGITSAGGTGTFDMHERTDEVQAGSYLLMDTAYDAPGPPLRTWPWSWRPP